MIAAATRIARSIDRRFAAILFDFDGVLVDSESVANRQVAAWLTAAGHPTTPEDAGRHFTGLAGDAFHAAVAQWVGGHLPAGFAEGRVADNQRVMAEGVAAVAGAVAFVGSLPPALPRAIVSSSSTAWIRRHLGHVGLADAFGDQLYSGREHVARGKPAPDLYLHAAARLGVPIAACVIIEDSVVGATGAVASGAQVIGLTAGSHLGPDHGERLRALGVQAVAASFDEVAAVLGWLSAVG